MLIEVRCPNGHLLHVKEKHAGKIGACPRCSAPVRVPSSGQVQGDGRLGVPPEHPRPSEPIVVQESRHDGTDWACSSDSSAFLTRSKGKLCVECGRIVSQSFAICPQCGTSVSSYRHLYVRKQGNAIVVQFDKHQILDELAVKEITEELCSVADRAGSHHLVVNLSKVVGLSSSMLGKLVMLQNRMEQKKRQLRLCNVGAEIRDVLAATKLHRILHVSESEDDALRAFASNTSADRPGTPGWGNF